VQLRQEPWPKRTSPTPTFCTPRIRPQAVAFLFENRHAVRASVALMPGIERRGVEMCGASAPAAAKCGETALTLTPSVRYRTMPDRRHPRAKGQQQRAPEGGWPSPPGSLFFLFPKFSAASELAWQNLVTNSALAIHPALTHKLNRLADNRSSSVGRPGNFPR